MELTNCQKGKKERLKIFIKKERKEKDKCCQLKLPTTKGKDQAFIVFGQSQDNYK